jgi:hypothetical protein
MGTAPVIVATLSASGGNIFEHLVQCVEYAVQCVEYAVQCVVSTQSASGGNIFENLPPVTVFPCIGFEYHSR